MAAAILVVLFAMSAVDAAAADQTDTPTAVVRLDNIALVPVLTGQTDRSAQLRLTQDGLEAPTVSEIRSDGYPSDIVVAQEPPAKTAASRVTLLVNRSEQSVNYVMPDLIGVNGDRAASLLRGHGFRATIVGSTPYPGVASGIVLRQSPQAGFQIAPGEAISIEVSR